MTDDPLAGPKEGDVGDNEPRELKSATVTESAEADGCSLTGAGDARGKGSRMASVIGLAIAFGAIARRRRH